MALSDDQIKELLYWFVTDSETRKKWSKTRIDALEENHKWIQPSVIEKLSDEELKKKFLDYYNSNTGYKQNINKLYRDRIIRDVGDFRKTINFLLDEKINIIERLDGVLEGDFKIEGFGKGILTAFLMDFDPDKYCLWNQKTEKGLEVLGWEMHKKGDSPGIKYQKVLGGLQRIRELRPDLDLGFVDVDLFLHTISAEEEGMEKVREFAGNEIVQASSHYWQIAPGEKARLWDDVRNNSIAAVGYDEFNFDVTNKSNNELFDLYKKHYSDATDRSISIQITQLLHFLNLKPGDKFVTNKGRSLLLGLGIVKGTYKFRPDRNEYRHTIDAEYYKVSESGIPIPESLKGKFGKTIVPLTQDEFETLERLFEGEEKDNAMLKE